MQDPEFLNTDGEHQHDDTVSSCSSKFEGEMNFSKLQHYIQSLIGSDKAQDLFRYKGVLAVKGMKKKFVFQGVHMIFSGGFSADIEWKEGETRDCRFVFIGRNLDKEEMIKANEALVKYEGCARIAEPDTNSEFRIDLTEEFTCSTFLTKDLHVFSACNSVS